MVSAHRRLGRADPDIRPFLFGRLLPPRRLLRKRHVQNVNLELGGLQGLSVTGMTLFGWTLNIIRRINGQGITIFLVEQNVHQTYFR